MADPVPRSLSEAQVAQALAWHRQVAAMLEAADRAGVALDHLPGLRERLATQAGLLNRAATRIGGPLPALLPTPAEIAVAGQALGDLSAPAIAGAVRTMHTTLAAAETALADGSHGSDESEGAESGARTATVPAAPQPDATAPGAAAPGRSEPLPAVTGLARYGATPRNAVVYGAYSAVVVGVQAVLFVLLDETQLPAAAPLCLLVLPALAWLAGYLTIGTLFPAPPGEAPNRTPRLGVVVCLLPNALLLAVVGILFAADTLA